MKQIAQKTEVTTAPPAAAAPTNRVLFNIKQASQSSARPTMNPKLATYQMSKAAFAFDRAKSFTISSAASVGGGRNAASGATASLQATTHRGHRGSN